MTEQEREEERRAKTLCVEALTQSNIKVSSLKRIDARIASYASSLIKHPNDHNTYELLGLLKFLRMLRDYPFDIAAAKRFIVFYEHLRFDGTHGRQSYKLTPVQVFQFAAIKGFYSDETHRLVRSVLLFVPRKFSKTTEVCSFAIDDFLFGDHNAQAYTGANSYDQAKICFNEIRKVLVDLDPGLRHFKTTRELIKWKDATERESFIRCLSNNPDKLDGLNASTVIMDEYAQADSADLKNVLTTSMGARENPLVITITTASDKADAPFFQELQHEKNVLLAEVDNRYQKDDTTFAHIFQPDCDDREDDPHTWQKVQPHLGITVQPDFYDTQYKEALKSADNMRAFRTKMLNEFVSGNDEVWITGTSIHDHSIDLNIDTLGYHADCEVAVDLSVDNDFSCVSYYIYLKNQKKAHIHTDYYFPEGMLKSHPNHELYQRWVDEGNLILCKGNIIDYDQIVFDIIRHGKNLHIYKVAYDPNKAATFTNMFINMGYKNYLLPYGQTYYHFTLPCQELPRMIEKDVITFNNNPINAYCADNCVLDMDNMGNCKPLKRNLSSACNRKIDGMITMLMALGASMKQER